MRVKKIITLIKKLLRTTKAKKNSIDCKYIIPRSQHHISKTDISVNALKVLNHLNKSGFEAYLVGGSVRDLLLRKAPKDFDIATNATPNQVRGLFKNARVIGRRFKLVHIIYHREIIEVATFRGKEPVEMQQITNERGMLIRDNVYGNLEEDAWRRDFTINSLYYNIQDSSIIDLTGGFKDIINASMRIIGNPNIRYQEDPVRMLRAIRFSAKLHFPLDVETKKSISELSQLISHVSGSRLFDEMSKIYQCGEAEMAHRGLIENGLFKYLFPMTAKLFSDSSYPVNAFLGIALENTDKRVLDGKPITPAFLFAALLWFPLLDKAKKLQLELDPLPALEKAMSEVIATQNKIVTIPKRFTQVMREIWILQYRFPKRTGLRAFHILNHSRFRAAYDFLLLRALAGDESIELATWWTTFQEEPPEIQEQMVKKLQQKTKPKRKNKKKPKAQG